MITLTVTPVSNVNYTTMQVIDNDLVSTRETDWDKSVAIFNTKNRKAHTVNAGSVSLIDHRLMEGGELFHLLHFFSVG